jgi:hypothetical protein
VLRDSIPSASILIYVDLRFNGPAGLDAKRAALAEAEMTLGRSACPERNGVFKFGIFRHEQYGEKGRLFYFIK